MTIDDATIHHACYENPSAPVVHKLTQSDIDSCLAVDPYAEFGPSIGKDGIAVARPSPTDLDCDAVKANYITGEPPLPVGVPGDTSGDIFDRVARAKARADAAKAGK